MKEASSATMTTSHSSPTGTVNSLALPQNLSGLFWLQATGNPPKVNVLAPIAGYRAQIMLSGRMSFFFFSFSASHFFLLKVDLFSDRLSPLVHKMTFCNAGAHILTHSNPAERDKNLCSAFRAEVLMFTLIEPP